MPRVRKPTPDEIRARRRALQEEASHGGLPYAEAIRQMRAATCMTQASFAEAFRLTPRQVVGLEAGKANPTVKTLARLGKTFGLQVGFVRPHPASSAQHKTEPQNSRLTSEKAAAVASFQQSLGRYGRTYAALTNGAAPNAAPKPASPEAIERSIEAIQASSGSRTPEQEAEITAFLRQIGAA